MRFDRFIISIIGLLLACDLYGQSETDLLVERLMEFMAEEQTEGFDFSALAERLEYYAQHPIDLNRTDGSELQELQFIPQLFIDNLLDHRNRSGKFVSRYELQVIEGVDTELLRLILPYVTVDTPNSLSGIRARQLV